MVFSIGLRVGRDEVTWVLRRPRPLLISAVAMFVVMPLVAALLVVLFRPLPPVGLVLIATSLSPVPPILPDKEMKAGAGASQAVGLMVSAGLLAIVLIPFGAELLAGWFGIETRVPMSTSAGIILTTILVPVLAGLVVGGLAPAAAPRLAARVGKLSAVVLLLAALPVLVRTAPAQWGLLGHGTLLVFVLFGLVGVAVGHVLGGPDPHHRTVLALSTASRHPGVAAAIALTVVPEAEGVLPGTLLYLLVSLVLTGLYLTWRHKRTPSGSGAA